MEGGATPPTTPRLAGGGLMFGEEPSTPKKKNDKDTTRELEPSTAMKQRMAAPVRSVSPELPKRDRVSRMYVPIRGHVAASSGSTPFASPLGLAFVSTDRPPSPQISDVPVMNGWFNNQFRTIGELGFGNFGHVIQAQHILDGVHYAVKILDSAIRNKREFRRRIDEARIMARCNSPQIVRYYSCWVEEKHLYLQAEYCPGGSLQAAISKGTYFTDDDVVSFISQLAIALNHLHEEVHVVHLDVKPENIYIGGDGSYKLGDFGHAHFLDMLDSNTMSNTMLAASIDSWTSGSLGDLTRFSLEEGDIRYLPLEMLNDKTYLKEADIFSLGVSAYELLSGVTPPSGSEQPWRTFREQGFDESLLTQRSCDLVQLIRQCIDKDPLKRLTAIEILRSNCVAKSGFFKHPKNRLSSILDTSFMRQLHEHGGMAKAP
eukprot:TRINITY_DN219_c3_g2_i1.p1 TRINITY_DN219_c3_g2~~TRINITY_DN219_c3_g2_i1.p1  ORF type:complete len:470 (+),score=72.36 TRINITY_DN219_c3_g2_i1:120-1412(+)